MFRHLQHLTWSFIGDGQPIAAISIYSEPQETETGIVYTPHAAAESGEEGLACVDDVARAVVLALHAYEAYGETRYADLARKWLTFVCYMQLADGQFTNFVLDACGRRNLQGSTSYPGGSWWTARALWALATAYRVLGDGGALDALLHTPLPDVEDSGDLKTLALFVLVGIEVLRSGAPAAVRAQWAQRVTRWCDALVTAGADQPYVPDARERAVVALWGYHQLHALAAGAAQLHVPAYLQAAEKTVAGLVRPVIAGNFYYAYPGNKADQCAYCITPLVQGLGELYRATGEATYRDLALQAGAWFYGANDAATVMYDVSTGRCFDGLTGTQVSRNAGAESAIEAGLAEVERHRLGAPTPTRHSTADVP